MACSNCNTPSCGCSGTYVVSQTCPPACSEVFNTQCIVYTGVDLVCNTDTVISRNDYLDTVITKLVNYICSTVAPPASVVAGSAFIDVVPTTDPVTSVTTYTVSADMAAFEIWVAPIITNQILAKVLAGPGIDVAADAVAGTVTVSHEDTSAVTDLSSNNSGNSFIQSVNFTFDTYGHVTGASAVPGTVVNANSFGQFDITDTDPGTYTWASVGSAIATNSGDTFTVLSGESIDVDVDTTALAMRVAFTGLTIGAGLSGSGTIASPLVNADGASTVTLASSGGTETLVNDGTGADLAVKGLNAGTGVTLTSTGDDITIANSGVTEIVAGSGISIDTGAGAVTVTANVQRELITGVGYVSGDPLDIIAHTLNETYISVRCFNGLVDVTDAVTISMVDTTTFSIVSSSTDVTDLLMIG